MKLVVELAASIISVLPLAILAWSVMRPDVLQPFRDLGLTEGEHKGTSRVVIKPATQNRPRLQTFWSTTTTSKLRSVVPLSI
jgi:hypothetical protein